MPNYQDLADPEELASLMAPGSGGPQVGQIAPTVLDALSSPEAGDAAKVGLAMSNPLAALGAKAADVGSNIGGKVAGPAVGAFGAGLNWLGGLTGLGTLNTAGDFYKRMAQSDAAASGPAGAPSGAPAPGPIKPTSAPTKPAPTSARPGVAGQPAPSGTTPSQPRQPDDIEQLGRQEQEALDNTTQTQTRAQEDIAKAKVDQVKSVEEGVRAYQQAVDQGETEARARMADVDRAIDDAAHSKIDPEAWAKSLTGGRQVAAVIGLALGGFAEGLGGANVAGRMINDAIKRNVDAQMANQGQANATVAQKSNAFNHFMQITGNKQQAQLATLEWTSKQALAKVDAAVAGTQSPMTLAAAQKAKAEIQQNMMALRAQRQKAAMEAVKTQAEIEGHKASAAAAYASARHTNAETRALDFQNQMRQQAIDRGDLLPEMRDRAVVIPGGKVVLVNRKESAEKLTPMVGSAGAALDEIDNAIKLVKTWGSSSDKTEAGNSLGIAIDAIIKNINQAEGINQGLQAEQIQMYKHALEKGAFKPDAATIAAFETLAHGIKRNVNKQLEAAGGGKGAGFAEPPSSAKPGVAK